TTATLAASGMGSTDADTRGYFTTSDVQDRAIAALDLMFQHGGPINGKAGQFAQVPLHGAAFWGWNRVVEYLLAKGAEINLADSRGYTAVDYAMGRAGGKSPRRARPGPPKQHQGPPRARRGGARAPP